MPGQPGDPGQPGRADRLAVRQGRRHRVRSQRLNTPVQATCLLDGYILITDQGNERVIEGQPRIPHRLAVGKTGVIGNAAISSATPTAPYCWPTGTS
jgi:hypothetical protein